jgi:hemolysin III
MRSGVFAVVSIARPQSLAEEIANSITHGLGLVAAVAAFPALVVAAQTRRDPLHVVGAAVFGATLVLCYLASTLYHAVHPERAPRAKQALRVVDHAAIFLLIAGTYTPFMLGALRGPTGWTMLAIVWTLAALGVVAKLRLGCRFRRLSTATYLGMGWLALAVIRPLAQAVGAAGVWWLVAGGLAYTVGVVFYACDRRLRYGHAVWHLFVAAGSACHFLAVLRHAWGPAAG